MAKLDWYIRSNLKPRHFQLLAALDDFKSVSRAAQYLNVTQPAISKALSEMEEGLGLKLFERTTKGIVPTPHGECLVRHARIMLTQLRKTRDELNMISYGARDLLRIGMLPGTSLMLMPQVVARLKQRSPLTTVAVQEGTIETLRPMLFSEQIDVIVGFMPVTAQTQDLESEVIYEDSLVAMISSANMESSFPGKSRPNLSSLERRGFTWILPPVGSLLREPIEAIFQQQGVAFPDNYIESVSPSFNVGLLHDMRAACFFPQEVARHFKARSGLAALPIVTANAVYNTCFTRLRHKPLTEGGECLLGILRDLAD